uniref:HMG box domain-containing protein n=1 Tax=Panagrellus redivivus TaxID=6233 RepID=A0A7E4VIN6_PANRE
MPSIDGDDVHCDHLTSKCAGFEYFSNNKEEQLRQLKSFADKDSAYLTELIRKAWNSFSANDKAIYHEEANVTPADLEEWIVQKGDSDVGDNTDKCSSEPFYYCRGDVTSPYIIYIREMNSIIVQDHFASNQKGNIKMLWLKGWMLLRQEQREEYGERSKKKWICYRKESTFQQIANREYSEFETAVGNEMDSMAGIAFRDDICLHGWSSTNHMSVQLFFKCTPSQRDEYYDKGYRNSVTKKAYELFGKDKLTEGHNLNDAEKKSYLEKAEKIVQNFIKSFKKGIKDTASIEDYDAVPVFKEWHNSWDLSLDDRAFNVYLIKTRPVLWKEPGMENKRCFELNLILKQRWNTLKPEEKLTYHEAVVRIGTIEEEIIKRKLKGYNFFQIGYNNVDYSELTAEEKLQFNGKKLTDRKQLLEDYPDLTEYFAWEPVRQHDRYKAKHHKIPEYDVKIKEYSGKPFIVKEGVVWYWFKDSDTKERSAFVTFEKELCTHCSDGLDATTKWRRWLELSDAQQAEYYEKYISKMQKEKALWEYCYCGFDSLEEAEKKIYMKKVKRKVDRKLHRETAKAQEKAAKNKKKNDRVPKSDASHLYIEHVRAYYRPKMEVSPYRSLEFNAFLPYFKKHISSFLKDPKNQHLPYARTCEKVEQSFWDLPDDKRKPYFDAVIRCVKLVKLLERLRDVYSYFDHKTKISTLHFYNLSEADQADYEKQLLEARVQLLRDNPDLTDYFYFRYSAFDSSDESDEDNESVDSGKKIPTALMCFFHSVCPIMQQDPKFKKKGEFQQRQIMKKAWKKLSKEQKAVYYEKQQRVQSRAEMKLRAVCQSNY